MRWQVLQLTCGECPRVVLRAAQAADQANLRHWKNANRERFFFRGVISAEAQAAWFAEYLTCDRDYMFLVDVDGRPAGCMGIRLLDSGWDVYNVILGDSAAAGKGYMSEGLKMMCSFASKVSDAPIQAKVLRDNPALAWYGRNGFVTVAEHDTYVEIKLDQGRSPASRPVPLAVEVK